DAPEPAEQTGNHYILFGFGKTAKRLAWFTTFEQHCVGINVGIQQSNRWIAVPEAQSLYLVLSLKVRHTQLENGGRSVKTCRLGYPRATDLVSRKRGANAQRPSLPQFVDGSRQSSEPLAPLRRLLT